MMETDWVTRAINDYRNNEWDAFLLECEAREPDAVELEIMKAIAYLRTGSLADALGVCDTIQDNLAGRSMRIAVDHIRGQTSAAELMDVAVSLSFTRWYMQIIGSVLASHGAWDEAREWLERAGHGGSEETDKAWLEGDLHFVSTRDKMHDRITALTDLGRGYRRRGRLSEARSVLRRALDEAMCCRGPHHPLCMQAAAELAEMEADANPQLAAMYANLECHGAHATQQQSTIDAAHDRRNALAEHADPLAGDLMPAPPQPVDPPDASQGSGGRRRRR